MIKQIRVSGRRADTVAPSQAAAVLLQTQGDCAWRRNPKVHAWCAGAQPGNAVCCMFRVAALAMLCWLHLTDMLAPSHAMWSCSKGTHDTAALTVMGFCCCHQAQFLRDQRCRNFLAPSLSAAQGALQGTTAVCQAMVVHPGVLACANSQDDAACLRASVASQAHASSAVPSRLSSCVQIRSSTRAPVLRGRWGTRFQEVI